MVGDTLALLISSPYLNLKRVASRAILITLPSVDTVYSCKECFVGRSYTSFLNKILCIGKRTFLVIKLHLYDFCQHKKQKVTTITNITMQVGLTHRWFTGLMVLCPLSDADWKTTAGISSELTRMSISKLVLARKLMRPSDSGKIAGVL